MLARIALLLFVALFAAAPARAAERVDVRIEGVGGELETNVRAFLSILRYAEAADLDDAMVERLLGRAEREVRLALRPFGRYEPQVATELRARERGGWEAVVRIVPGPEVRLVAADVRVTGPGAGEPFLAAALAQAPLRAGGPLRHADYDATKGELLRAAAAHGYLDAQYEQADLAVDVAAREARATLVLATGERYRFGATRIEQSVISARLVERFLRWREGDWYDAAALLRTQFALDDSEYFGLVEVLPGERDREARTVPVNIHAHPGRRQSWSVAAGYATDTRFRGTLGFRDRRINDRGHRLSAELTFSQVERRTTLGYVLPWHDPALEKLAFDLGTSRTEAGDLEIASTSLRAGLTEVLGGWQRVLSVTATSTRSGGIEPRAGVAADPLRRRDNLLVPAISYAALPRTISGASAGGRGFFGELLGSHSALGSRSDFVRLRLQDERRLDLAPDWALLLRGQLGLSAVADFDELPADYRFFAGGDRSVRGYGLDELSPRNAAGERIGGRHLLVASVELERALPRNFAVAAFVDGGNALNRLGDPLEYSAGIGLRYRLPFVSVGIDVAQSLSDPGRGPRLHLNVAPVF